VLKKSVSKAAADECTGGVHSSPAHPELPRQLVSQVGYFENAFEVRTPHGKRRASARQGRAGEKSGFFSILLVQGRIERHIRIMAIVVA
jgi:hypothetical protein